jgi:hypothetical protein
MLDRCYRENAQQFRHYGGRGITVCDRWRESFENFLADMGPKPTPKHSIDRFPDTNGNYEPGNCRWATQSQQMRNSRLTRMVTVNGETRAAADWGDETGVKYKTIVDRIDHGVSAEDAIALKRYGMRRHERYDYNGQSLTLEEWAPIVGASKVVLYQRLRKGWTVEQAFSSPCIHGKRALPTGRGRWANRNVTVPSESSATAKRKGAV